MSELVDASTGLVDPLLGPVRGFRGLEDRPWLWAPDAHEVLLEVGDSTAPGLPCRRDGEHWYPDRSIAAGERYRFVVDGAAVPDPRSRSQPDGVHGASEWIPAGAVGPHGPAVTGRGLRRSVIYELHVGTFSAEGTFSGAVDHLDHLVELGVTHVELMPVAAFDGRFGWGYDGVDLFAPHPGYGTESDLNALVAACHRRGLAVLVDVVLNHLGPSGNVLWDLGPYFTDRYSTPWGDALNLDGPGSDGVRRYLLDAASHWLEDLDADGLRLDAVHALYDMSAVHLLEELADEVRELGRRTGRPRMLIAESDRGDPRIVAPSPTGPGMDGVWADDLHHCLHVALTGERLGYYEDVHAGDLELALVAGSTHQGRWSPHRRRSVGRTVAGTSSERLVVGLQNHDQVGNRARGERMHHLVGEDRAAAAAALVLLSPFSTLLFQGEEWAASTPFAYFSDHAGELGGAVSEGRRREFAAFGWAEDEVADPQDPATFHSAVLRWDERWSRPHSDVFDWYRSLISLRRRHDAFAPVELPTRDRIRADGQVVEAHRGPITVLANLGDAAVRHEVRVDGHVLVERCGPQVRGTAVDLPPGAVLVVDRT